MKLVTNTFKNEVAVEVAVPTHRIIVVDVSGSMHGELQKLRTHLKNKLPTMVAPDDTMSLMWFSGRNQFGTIFENIQISTVQDLSKINTAIDRFLTAQGLTGFKQPLQEVSRIVDANRCTQHSMYFMTDGYDNQWQRSEILTVCAELADKLSSATFVEYGYYADHDMLVSMAEEVGGAVVMAENFQKYSDDLERQFKSSVTNKKIAFSPSNLAAGYQFVVGVTDDSIVTCTPKNGTVQLPGNTTSVVYFSGNGKLESIDDRATATGMLSALILRGQADTAIEVAELIGDRELFKKIENSFSKQDYSRAIEYANLRATGKEQLGKVEKLKVSPNAYNVLTMLMDLAEDGNFLHLSHPDFKYTRGGAARVADDTIGFVSKFSDKAGDVKAPISALKFDSDRPNISILVRREGTATLPPNDFGFGESVDTFIWRSYTIVRDGIVNVEKLPVVVTKSTYDVLAKHGVISEPFVIGKTYVIDTTKYPVINRSMATPIDSSTMFSKQFEMYKLQAEQKYVKTFIEKPEYSEEFVSKYGEEATAFLKQYGITPGGFAPPTSKTIAIDSYIAKVLEIKMTGLNTLSKADDVTKAIAANKALTPSQQVYRDVMNKYGTLTSVQAEAAFATIKQQLNVVRNEIIIMKFGVILGKKWFTDMTSYDDNTREMDFGLSKTIKCQAVLSDVEV